MGHSTARTMFQGFCPLSKAALLPWLCLLRMKPQRKCGPSEGSIATFPRLDHLICKPLCFKQVFSREIQRGQMWSQRETSSGPTGTRVETIFQPMLSAPNLWLQKFGYKMCPEKAESTVAHKWRSQAGTWRHIRPSGGHSTAQGAQFHRAFCGPQRPLASTLQYMVPYGTQQPLVGALRHIQRPPSGGCSLAPPWHEHWQDIAWEMARKNLKSVF